LREVLFDENNIKSILCSMTANVIWVWKRHTHLYLKCITGMHNTINEYIKSCDQCQKMDRLKKATDELHPIPVVSPWYHVGMDMVKMPVSKSGNNYLLTVMDYFTKWPHAVPIPDKSARTVASALYNICMVMGFPAVYSSDQG
jgi:hypothetical protein